MDFREEAQVLPLLGINVNDSPNPNVSLPISFKDWNYLAIFLDI